jgi:plastocyanin
MRRTLFLLLPLTLAACGAPAATTPSATNPSAVSTVSRTPVAPPKMETVTMSEDGFSPKEVKIPAGGAVVFLNKGTKAHRPASDPHPEHTDYYGFDSLVGVSTGSTYTFTFTKVGTWKYHDETDPKKTGTIIVEAVEGTSVAPTVAPVPAPVSPAAPASKAPVTKAPVSAAPASGAPSSAR